MYASQLLSFIILVLSNRVPHSSISLGAHVSSQFLLRSMARLGNAQAIPRFLCCARTKIILLLHVFIIKFFLSCDVIVQNGGLLMIVVEYFG